MASSSTLKLVIQKGPREGETLEYSPRSTIRIGRVARGNNLIIKDSGISSKHLQIDFDSSTCKWLITDLDSSNGTFLNSIEIEPFSPCEISHGDEIKIGEITAIRVEVFEIGGEFGARRRTRRQGGGGGGVECEYVEIKGGVEKFRNPRKGGDCEIGGEVVEGSELGENVEIKDGIEKFWNPRKGGDCKIGGEVIKGSELGENVEIKGGTDECKDPRKGEKGNDKNDEGSKMVESVESMDEVEICKDTRKGGDCQKGIEKNDKGLELGENVVEVGIKEEERGGRDSLNLEGCQRGRRRGQAKKLSVEVSALKPECSVNTRRTTRSSTRGGGELVSGLEMLPLPVRKTRGANKAEGVMEKIVENKDFDADECKEVECSKVVENNKPRGRRGRKKKEASVCLDNAQDTVLEEKMNLVVSEKDGVECLEKVQQAIIKEKMNAEVSAKEGDESLEKDQEAVLEEMMNLQVLEKEDGECLETVQAAIPKEQINLEISENEGGGGLEKVHQAALEEQINLELLEKEGSENLEEQMNLEVHEAVLEDKMIHEVSKKGLDKDLEFREQSFGTSKVPATFNMPDLEKMTLGEWFDFLEVYLPNQIYAATNRVIEDMQKDAKLFNDFMLQQQQDKSKHQLVTDQTQS